LWLLLPLSMSDKDNHQPQQNTGGQIIPDTPDKEAFIRGLLARGEAARPNPDGSLPKGVTHEIIGDGPNGLPIVRRRRFY
jgi:hypothetical protein